MAYRMGKLIVEQKNNFCGKDQGPESSENVLHIVDLAYVPSHEKEIVRENFLKGTKDKGNSKGIIFINNR